MFHELAESQWHRKAYIGLLYFTYAIIAIAYTGVIEIDPSYLDILNKILKYYICFFLILRFNPWIKYNTISKKTLEFDRYIAFKAGIFLLLTTTLSDIVQDYFKNLKNKITNKTNNISMDFHK